MNITFRKKTGNPSLGIEFYWMMAIQTGAPATITDYFIPELFFDYFFIKQGQMVCADSVQSNTLLPGKQTLKTLHTSPLKITYSTPLVLFGVRLSLRFAEIYWEDGIQSGSFLDQDWVNQNTDDLSSFSFQVAEYLGRHRGKRHPYPLLTQSLEETTWLKSFSARHKRRLYRSTFGLSRKELKSIRSIHAFLAKTCDFSSQNPRIIEHLNPDVFYDQPHLNHAFKKWTGLSPLEYFETNSILQDNLMAVSYNAIPE